MTTNLLRFDGACEHAVGFDEHGTNALPAGATSLLMLRYVLVGGEVVDQYAGLTDEEAVLAHVQKQEEASAARAAALAAKQATAPVKLTKLGFMRRFTPAEYAAFKTKAGTDAVVDYFWQLMQLAEEIDLRDQATIDGTRYLEVAGVIAAGRADQILAA